MSDVSQHVITQPAASWDRQTERRHMQRAYSISDDTTVQTLADDEMRL